MSDLTRWDAALWAGKILTKASQEAMFTQARLPDGSSVPYGFGWLAGHFDGPRFVSHAGSLPGASTYMVRYLDLQLTVIVLINRSEATASQIARHIAGIYDPKVRSIHASHESTVDPAVTVKMRTVLEGIQNGSVDNQMFGPEMWAKGDEDQTLGFLHNLFASLGPLRSVSFMSLSQQGDKRQYFYVAMFGDTDEIVDFTLDGDGKITAMGVQSE